MKIDLKPGTYVVAVSGGVDSMGLLNALCKLPKIRLVIAHFDHGIRPDSHEDRHFVQERAANLGLPFVFHEGRLGESANEETARKARYNFLQTVVKAAGAQAVITAHHQDDVLETAIHNLLRGTGRKGLSSLSQNSRLIRPLLNLTKQQIIDYAKKQGLKWREDSTNQDLTYTRNYIRHQIIPKLTEAQKKQLLKHLDESKQRNEIIDELLAGLLKGQPKGKLDKQWFISLSHPVAKEVMATWLRQNNIREFDRKLLEQLVTAAKTLRNGGLANVNKDYKMLISAKDLALVKGER